MDHTNKDQEKVELKADSLDYLSPEIREKFDSMYRKERLMSNKIIYQKQCVLCKCVSGTFFAALGAFQAWRTKSLWSFYPPKEKAFNVFGALLLFAIAGANFNAGYQSYMGKSMQLVEMRPSLYQRLTGQVEMSPSERQKYLETLIKYEEEKAEVSQLLKEQERMEKSERNQL